MNSQAIAMSRNDNFDVFEIWEYIDERWELLLVARPKITIGLYYQKPEMRLVFPVGFNPNIIGKETLARKKRKYKRKQQQPPARSRKRKLNKVPKSNVAKTSKLNRE